MLSLLARVIIAAPKRVLFAVVLFTILAGAFGASVVDHLGAAGFQDPNSESARGMTVLTEKFGQGDMDLTLVVRSPNGVLDPSATPAGRAVVDTVRGAQHISGVVSPWDGTPQGAGLISKDGKTALVIAGVSGGENNAPKYAKAVADQVRGEHDGLTVLAGGTAMVTSDINDQSEKDLLTAESIALPLSLLALIWVFGGLFAAMLPLVVGVMAIVGTLGMLRCITLFADVSVFSLDLTTAMGLALAIDYTLLLVSRYREEHAKIGNRDEALRRALSTAGRTILFSACTVFLAVGALAVFPMYFLRSMAYAGCGVVALAGLYAVVVAPVVIKLLGDRIESLNIRKLFGRKTDEERDIRESFLYRTATWVMRHAVPCMLIVVALLLVVGSPFLSARFGLPDDRVLPTSAESRQVGDTLRAEFPDSQATATSVVIPDAQHLSGDDVGAYAAALSNVPGVVAVSAPDTSYVQGRPIGPPLSPSGMKDGSVWMSIAIEDSSSDSKSRAELDRLRAVPTPGGTEALFTGPGQLNQDSVDEIVRLLPVVLILIATTTFLLVFLLTGSLLLPVKALVLNSLSLSTTLGALVWVFQEGHLGGLGTTATGTLVADVLVFLFATAFGLSMDYEVFLLSRIREHWLASPQRSQDNTEAVALGIAGAGRVITAAALLMVIVFAALSAGEVAFMRMIGVGLALAVVVDATLVRMVLVPAVMRLAGRWNWWAPAPLTKLHAKLGLEG